ncbi:endonuclease G, mitochondrial isoform X1 [Syngnathoides biaculeatus]|uniref:endonuclease G, mitochondrial isoform X1 n=1 Tax=Syngnathoides biaculeatus TaxID=300417 RepID=UPI002ADE863D|nr:endonuclease G, mitochondrial isoform X1 [Syngnathoides biaculeatus]
MTGRWRTTLATLSFGAALGASAGHFWRLSGGREEQPTVGLLGRLPVVPAVPVPNVHAASELTLSQPPGGAVMKYGFPSLSNIRTRESYVSSYDPRTRTPAWVIERLGGDTLGGNADRKRCDFKEDDSVHIFHRATNADYKGSGLDRGHMAAAANHKWSQKAMDDTFYLTNVAPQNPHMNQNAWNNLEKLCRSLTRHYANVYVCTGPLYLPRQEADGKLYVRYQVLGRNHVAVPTHFFKVLVLERDGARSGVELRSYILPNQPVDDKIPLERFLVPIETIERASGLLFLPNIVRMSGGAVGRCGEQN